MSYLTQDAIANNAAMANRMAQAAATEGVPDADTWVGARRREWAAAPGWDEAWESYVVSNPDSDPGMDEAVITDGMILSQVQSMLGGT